MIDKVKDKKTREGARELLEKLELSVNTKDIVLKALENLENGDLEDLLKKIKNLNK